MSGLKFAKSKGKTSISFSPSIRESSLGRSFSKPYADDAYDTSNIHAGHNFSKIRVDNNQSFLESCPLALSAPNFCPFGGACHACPVQIQREPTLDQASDNYERISKGTEEQELRMRELWPDRNAEASTDFLSNNFQRMYPYSKPSAYTVPHIVRAVLGSPGHALESNTRAYMEARFGYDFSNVRVHKDSKAAESARAVNSKAYTVRRNIVFGEGQYQPETIEGLRLLAHELSHVVQQRNSSSNFGISVAAPDTRSEHIANRAADGVLSGKSIGYIQANSVEAGVLQRAEAATAAGCSELNDTKADVNDKINRTLANERVKAADDVTMIINGLYNELGKNVSIGRTAIEVWAESLGPTKVRQPRQERTKYAGVTYGLWAQPFFPILNPTMRINNICVGSDKLGHFIQQGYDYLIKSRARGESTAAAEAWGFSTEAGGYGLATTGVFSNADLEANKQGLSFYEDLLTNPTMTFDIGHYINDRWNEEINPSFYERSVGSIVWRNLVHASWRGRRTASSDTGSQPIVTNLNVSNDNTTLSGQYGYTPSGGDTINGTISGRITQQRNRIGAITGIQIDFSWREDSRSGKGQWTSRGESELEGTWGTGASNSDGGTWNMTRSSVPLRIPLSQKDACIRQCEDAFNHCVRTSRTGGLSCLASRGNCLITCGRN